MIGKARKALKFMTGRTRLCGINGCGKVGHGVGEVRCGQHLEDEAQKRLKARQEA